MNLGMQQLRRVVRPVYGTSAHRSSLAMSFLEAAVLTAQADVLKRREAKRYACRWLLTSLSNNVGSKAIGRDDHGARLGAARPAMFVTTDAIKWR